MRDVVSLQFGSCVVGRCVAYGTRRGDTFLRFHEFVLSPFHFVRFPRSLLSCGITTLTLDFQRHYECTRKINRPRRDRRLGQTHATGSAGRCVERARALHLAHQLSAVRLILRKLLPDATSTGNSARWKRSIRTFPRCSMPEIGWKPNRRWKRRWPPATWFFPTGTSDRIWRTRPRACLRRSAMSLFPG